MTSKWRVTLLALAFGCWAAHVNSAGPIVFDFSGINLGTFTPLNQTVSGVTATFSSTLDITGPKFSVQNAASAGFVQLSTFDGSFLYPNSLGVAPLTITFSEPVNSISLVFATVEQHIASSMYLTAYLGGTLVGTTTGPGAYIAGDTYPQGAVSFAGTAFNRVELKVPLQGTEPAVAFFVDTVTVNTVGPAAAALQASWQLEDGWDSQAAADLVGGHHGQLGSTADVDSADPVWVPGRTGNGLAFDGAQYVVIPDDPALSPEMVSVEAWVRSPFMPAGYLVAKGADVSCTTVSYGLRVGTGGGVEFVVKRPGGAELVSPATSTDIWDGLWHFVTGTFDRGAVRMFVDGVQAGSGTSAAPAFSIDYSLPEGRLAVGAHVGEGCGPAIGTFTIDMDQVGIWDGALSAQAVAERFAALNLPFATETMLASDVATSTEGDPVELTADVWSNNGAPGGTVTFLDGETPLDTLPLTNGRAVLVVTTLSAGAHTLSASFTPEGLFEASVSEPLAHTVTSGQDTQPPVVTVPSPSPLDAEATGPAGAVVVFEANAVDDVDGPVSVTCNPASGATFPLGSTTVTCSATDNAGNTASASFSVRVRDKTSPTIPIWLPVTNVTSRTVTLNWDAAGDIFGVHHYRIHEMVSKGNKPPTWPVVADGITATSFAVAGLKPGSAHVFRVVAVDTSDNESDPSTDLLVQLPKK